MRDMRAGSAVRHKESLSDMSARIALRKQLHHLALAFRQPIRIGYAILYRVETLLASSDKLLGMLVLLRVVHGSET